MSILGNDIESKQTMDELADRVINGAGTLTNAIMERLEQQTIPAVGLMLDARIELLRADSAAQVVQVLTEVTKAVAALERAVLAMQVLTAGVKITFGEPPKA